MPADANTAKCVFLAALEKTAPADRTAYLDAACAGDDALRRQVEGLLHSHDRPDALLDRPAADHLAAAGAEVDLHFLGPPTRPDWAAGVYDNFHNLLSVDELAQQLAGQKLTAAIRTVKLYACKGGSGAANSTAKQLKDAMVARGFTNVTVYGYTMCLAQGGTTRGHKTAGDWDPNSRTWSNTTGAKSVRVRV